MTEQSLPVLPPSGGGVRTLLRAALPSLPGAGLVPGVRKVSPDRFEPFGFRREAVRVDPAHVAAYAAVCRFPRKDTVPITYPHLLAFELHMAIMSDSRFPFPAIGTVHLENTISQHRPVAVGETLDVATRVEAPRTHPKGTVVDFVTTVHSGGELVWESVSSYLRRGRGGEPSGGLTLDVVPAGTTTWRLGADLGRRYGAVSGDVNPIHLTPLTAKALGFRRHIAHGMWTKAASLAAVENRLPGAVRVEVAFKTPVFLPATVGFGVEAVGDQALPDLALALTNPRTGAPHLVGRTHAL